MHSPSPVAEAFFSGNDLSLRVLDSLQAAIIVTDLSGAIQVWNRGAERLYGWLAEEVLGKSVVDVVPSAMSRAQAAALMVQLTAGESWSGVFEVQRKEGSTFRALVTDSPLRDERGNLIGVVGSSYFASTPVRNDPETSDVASSRRIESGLRFVSEASRVLASSLDYESTLDTITGLAIPYMADYCVMYLGNEDGVFQRVLGVHADRAQRDLLNVVMKHHTPDPRNASNPTIRAMRTHRTSLHLDLSREFYASRVSEEDVLNALIELDGRSGIVTPLVSRGRAIGALWLVRNSRTPNYDMQDVEIAEELARLGAAALENARLYETAENARERAQEANRAKANFVAVISHELRTPLNAISGYVELLSLEVNGPLSEKQRAHIERIKTNQQRVTSLLNDVLEFAKVETGHVRFEIGPVSLDAVLAGIEPMTLPLLHAKGMSLELEPVPQDVSVFVDRDRAQQILLNLLSNAVKFSPAGSRILVSCETSPTHVSVHVSDQGYGIPPAKLEAVFEPFVRVSIEGVRRVEGSGLGLAISRDLARSMGAELTVSSTLGHGSVFTLRMPRIPPIENF
jgi:PAS domain S-box-containing protein